MSFTFHMGGYRAPKSYWQEVAELTETIGHLPSTRRGRTGILTRTHRSTWHSEVTRPGVDESAADLFVYSMPGIPRFAATLCIYHLQAKDNDIGVATKDVAYDQYSYAPFARRLLAHMDVYEDFMASESPRPTRESTRLRAAMADETSHQQLLEELRRGATGEHVIKL